MAEPMSTPLLWTLFRRPGTQLLAVILADSVAFGFANTSKSSVAVMTYLLQMLLVYRVWRGENMVPWLLLFLITIYEGFCVYVAASKGAMASYQTWVVTHAIAVLVTVLVLVSPGVRRRLSPLRGPRAVE
jgi:hypothetical protein